MTREQELVRALQFMFQSSVGFRDKCRVSLGGSDRDRILHSDQYYKLQEAIGVAEKALKTEAL